jgi:hypothetical protein
MCWSLPPVLLQLIFNFFPRLKWVQRASSYQHGSATRAPFRHYPLTVLMLYSCSDRYVSLSQYTPCHLLASCSHPPRVLMASSLSPQYPNLYSRSSVPSIQKRGLTLKVAQQQQCLSPSVSPLLPRHPFAPPPLNHRIVFQPTLSGALLASYLVPWLVAPDNL